MLAPSVVFYGSFRRLETIPHRAPVDRGLRTPNSPLSFLVLFDPVVAVKLHTENQGVVRTSQDFRAVLAVYVYVVTSVRDLSLVTFW